MRGNITRRGRHSWRIKFDLPGETTRGTRYITVRGRRQDAERELARLVASAGAGSYVEPTKDLVADFVRGRIDQWEAAGDVTARTAQRYRQLLEHQIVPHLVGAKMLQRLTRLDLEGWHTTLRNDGLAARTIGHAHKLLGKALGDAERDGVVVKNVCKLQKAPKVTEQEMVIVRDMPAFVEKLQGSALEVPALLGLLCGLRLGEVLGLRWSRVDLDGRVVQVREALEQTKAYGIRFKAPKSKAGRRDITLPDIAVDALRAYVGASSS